MVMPVGWFAGTFRTISTVGISKGRSCLFELEPLMMDGVDYMKSDFGRN